MPTITSGATPPSRVHILNGADWARSAGTDFWLIGGASEESSATGAGLRTLDGGGWTATSITEYTGLAGDFLSSADDDPSAFHLDAAADLIQSPSIFGSYAHARMAQEFLGAMPTELNVEVYSQFTDATGAGEISGFGFVEGGGSIVTSADHLAVVYSDGTNFKMRSGAAATAAGAVDDTAWHLWKIQIVAAGCYHWMDGTLKNTTVLALETDEFPVAFGIGVEAAKQNFQKLAWAHVWYA